MKTEQTLLLALALTLPLAGARADTFTWTGNAMGDTNHPNESHNWFNVTNWSFGGIPGPAYRTPVASDTVFVGGYADVPSWTFTDLHLTGGALQGNFTVGGTLHWTAGALAGTVIVQSNAVVNLAFTQAGVLNGVLVNHGQIVWPAGSWSSWAIDGGQFENSTDGLFDMQLDGDVLHGPVGPGVFNNAGTFRKSGSGAGSGWAQFRPGIIFNNSGLVDLQSGALHFTDGFTSSGQFAVATNTALQLGGGTFHLLPGHVFTGPGTYEVYGNVIIDGPIAEPRFRLSSGTLTMSNQITGTLLWDRWATLAGEPTIASNGVIKVINPPGGFPVTLSGVLTNYGLFLWPTGSYSAIVLDNGRLENMPGALVDVQVDGGLHRGPAGPGVFNNAGTLRKSVGYGGSEAMAFNPGFVFNNTGLVELQSGTFQFTDGFTSSGLFTVATNTAVKLTGGTFHFLPGHRFTGTGSYGVFGSVVIDGPITEPDFLLAGSSLTMTNQITGTLVWQSGRLDGAPTIASHGVVRYVAGSAQPLSGVLTNHGLFLWPAGTYSAIYFSSGRLENMADGLVDLQVDAGFYSDGGSAQVNNAGVLRKRTGSGTGFFASGVGFLNTGLLDVQSGTMQLPGNSLAPGSRINCGLASPSVYGRVSFDSSVALAGTLGMRFIGGYVPAAGSSFAVVSYPSHTGNFATLDLPSLSPPDGWQLGYGASDATLFVIKGRPSLQLTPSGSTLVFAWPTNALSGYALQRATNLVPAIQWTTLPDVPSVAGDQYRITVLPGDGNSFYRLIK